MRVPLRLQCAMIAVAILPCVATAQTSPLGGANTEASDVGPQPSAAPMDLAVPQSATAANASAIASPAATVVADPSPSSPSTEVTSSGPGDQRAMDDRSSGPTASSATAGIRSRAAGEHLTRQQLADRASRDQDEGHQGLGRDAALMIIGGAGIIVGALVGGSAGTALIVVGAVIGITGLVLIIS